MNFELLAKQGREKVHPGLAGINRSKLIQLRNENLRNCFSSFHEEENRLNVISRIHGVEFINDTASETTNSTWFSLESMTKPTIWIACSGNNEPDLTSLIPLALEKVKILICVGKGDKCYRQVFAGIIPFIFQVNNLKEAVNKASYLSQANDVVLFSPSCSANVGADLLAEEFKMAVLEL